MHTLIFVAWLTVAVAYYRRTQNRQQRINRALRTPNYRPALAPRRLQNG